MKPIKVEDFATYKMLSAIKLSADGTAGVVCVSQADIEANNYRSNLWAFDAKGGKFRQLTSGNSERSFDFGEANSVIFPAIRTEKDKKAVANGELLTVFNTINLDGGEATELFRVPLAGATAKRVSKDTYLISAVHDNARPEFETMRGEKLDAAKKAYKESEDYEVVDELPFWSNGHGFVNKKRSRLYLYNTKKSKLTAITEPMFSAEASDFCEACGMVFFTGAAYTAAQKRATGLFAYNIEAGTTETIIPADKYAIGHLCLGDHKLYFTANKVVEGAIQAGTILATVCPKTKQIDVVIAEVPEEIGCTTGCDVRYGGGNNFEFVNGALYCVTSYDNTSALSVLDEKTKELKHLTTVDFGVDIFAANGSKFFTVGLLGTNLQEVYELNVATGTHKKISSFNATALKDKYVAEPKLVSFKNKAGVRIDGFVLEPIDYDAKSKYPAILEIHGGPRTNYCGGFMHEMQAMASRGAFVMFCNPRGSSARGEEFADIRGKYGSIDYDDIMEFTDVVLKKYPQIDTKRLGVTGGSYGGFMTNWIIGHTKKFAAAASQRSISNWISFYGVSDIGPWFGEREMGGATPWKNMEVLWDASPLKYAMNAVTPTLFIHAMEDYRCWLPEGIQMYNALQVKGVETRMCMFKGENHELSRNGKPKHRIKRLTEINEWLFKYMG